MHCVPKMIVIVVLWSSLCGGLGQAGEDAPIAVRSPAFAENETMAKSYTCDGIDESPPLAWSGIPRGTKTLALVVSDPDAPSGVFTHWVVYNLPSSVTALPTNIPHGLQAIDGSLQAVNDFQQVGYNGPCPPPGPPHHYHFQVFALDDMLTFRGDVTGDAVRAAMHGHILASGETVARFGR